MALKASALSVLGALNAGASIEINAGDYSSLDRLGFANAVKEGATLRILNSGSMSDLDRLGVANAGKGRVILA